MAGDFSIEAVETVIVDVPTVRPHVLAMATMNTQAMVIMLKAWKSCASSLLSDFWETEGCERQNSPELV